VISSCVAWFFLPDVPGIYRPRYLNLTFVAEKPPPPSRVVEHVAFRLFLFLINRQEIFHYPVS